MDVVGTDGADNLNGAAGDDEIFSRRGDDFAYGFGGNDRFYWNTGHGNLSPDRATIEDSDGADLFDGGAGTGRIYVLGDYRQMLSGRNSDTYLMSHALTANPDGSVSPISGQAWDNYGTTPSTRPMSTSGSRLHHDLAGNLSDQAELGAFGHRDAAGDGRLRRDHRVGGDVEVLDQMIRDPQRHVPRSSSASVPPPAPR